MSDELGPSFESIESAQEFVDLLAQAIEEAKQEIQAQIEEVTTAGDERRVQALRLVAFKLDGLSVHMSGSRRLLNDLRTLRRLLLDERRG
jgi:predicted nuclease of restriction endonuclease-like RecB superfamily